ncbi:hypothetical protein Clacol_007411 [Clathrus columnatus]|uniref:Dopey N-terminal domain-containing protein n=1 Tax=Clathrus columnatus TaxID=1419009 RepID=A0AAV5AJW4_9AGAM|nr:hypothetical protein Clacol_007411 [Clathrus columnatus]
MYHLESNTSTPRVNKDVTPANVLAVNSSKASPGSAKARLAALNTDPKFKKYIAQVDRCLQTFDNVHEWADFIAFLTKLLKTFQSFPQFKEIPRKLVVAKRLSQCLNPALPTGVHQRALDVYIHILTVSGTEGLKHDIQLWSAGLFPFFEYAATSVKPILLNLYDTYYLPLQGDLRSIMKAFILALLPGLEEETGTVSPAFFLQNLWVIIITTPTARRTSLNFLSRRLPKLNGDDDISYIIGRDIGLMIRAFAAALEDNDILVRRAMLDILDQTLPLNSASLKRASITDQRMLMSAASNVVLRRDLSLNRRLFAWLLGSGTEDEQVAFFRLNGLQLLRDTLKENMFAPHPDPRAFKVFISLLDKWEIGGPLVDVLLYDAFKSLQVTVTDSANGNSELLMAANSLYDSVEPLIIWKLFFSTMRTELLEPKFSKCECMSLIRFVLTRFRTQEDEVKDVHLPIFFSAYMELLKNTVISNRSAIFETSFHDAFATLLIIAEYASNSGLNRPFPPNPVGEFSDPYIRASEFYEVPLTEGKVPVSSASRRSNVPIITSFEDLVYLSMSFADALMTVSGDKRSLLEDTLIKSLKMLSNMAARVNDVVTISWEPRIWTKSILTILQSSTSFTLVDSVISNLVDLGSSLSFQPRLNLDTRAIMVEIALKLFNFLRSNYTLYHVRVVHLLWSIEAISTHNHLESLFAQSLTSSDPNAFDAFGVFWRLTGLLYLNSFQMILTQTIDDSLLPGFKFKLPLLMVLDMLKNPDPEMRRLGETWMRCNMKSYLRILEPLLFDLLDPSIIRKPLIISKYGYDISAFQYEKQIDQNRMNHLLETLLSVVKFGSQGLSRIARNALYRKSFTVDFVKRVDNADLVQPGSSYMDVMLEILFRYLQSEPIPELKPVMSNTNIKIHSSVLDLIQVLTARGDFSVHRLQLTQKVIVEKLCISVHEDRYDLQNRLLHLLHSTFSGLSAILTQDNRTGSSNRLANGIEKESSAPVSQVPEIPIDTHPILLPTLLDGISKTAGRQILQYWLDFILMTIPLFPRLLGHTVVPLSDCICRQLWFTIGALADVFREASSSQRDIHSNITDTEVVMLLNTLERLAILSLAKGGEPGIQDKDEETTIEKYNQDTGGSGGILGIMTNVFTSDTSANATEEALSLQSPGYRVLLETIRLLYALWSLTSQIIVSSRTEQDSFSFISTRVQTRCRKMLERFFHTQSMETSSPAVAFNIVDNLTTSAQTAVHMLCESISLRITNVDKARRSVINPNVFLEEYFSKLEGPVAIQVWGRFTSLTREILNNVQAYKLQLFPVLKCMAMLCDKVIQTTAFEDRKLRKELQLLDNCVLIAGRSFDQGTWLRRNTKDTLATNGRSSPMPPDEKSSVPHELSTQTSNVDIPDQVIAYLVSNVIPSLRRLLFDNDRMVTLCTNIVYYVVNPTIKTKTGRTIDIDINVFELLSELSHIPMAAKAWKGPISDVFNDNRFFNFPPEMGMKWAPLTNAFIDSDKLSIPEMLSMSFLFLNLPGCLILSAKITPVGSSNIFANREAETLSRALNLRRLSYALFADGKNHFISQLPSIQEKLVDILRNQNPAAMESEVYLCLRVLLCRLSPHNMSGFWPLRLFDQVISEPPPDDSDELRAVLSAYTVDAVYRPDSWTSEALFDQLADVVRDLPIPKNTETGPLDITLPVPHDKLDSAISATDNAPVSSRKPLLSRVHRIRSIRDLLPFFSHISIASYEAMYYCVGNLDWAGIEDNLIQELFYTQ